MFRYLYKINVVIVIFTVSFYLNLKKWGNMN